MEPLGASDPESEGSAIPTEEHQASERVLADLAERGRVEAELRRLTRVLRTVSAVKQVIIHATEETELLRGVCEALVQTAGYRTAWVGYAEHDQEKSLRPVTWAGAGADYLEHIKVSWGSGPTGRGPGGRSVREHRPVVVRDIRTNPGFAPWRTEALRNGYQSMIALPLLDPGGGAIGVFSIYAPEPDAFDAEEVTLLSELANDLAFGIEVLRERRRRTDERSAHLRFFESIDQVHRAMQGTNDLERMMSDVLDAVLEIFDCDRAWLLHPLDPEADSWRVPMIRYRQEYPPNFTPGEAVPMMPDVQREYRIVLDASGPVAFGPRTEDSALPQPLAALGVESQVVMALYPKTGRPWMFGLHQCSHARVWTAEEQRLAQEIGRRLADALTTLLTFRDLQEREAQYRSIVDTATEGIWVLGPDDRTTFVNARLADLLGWSVDEMLGRPVTDFLHEEDIQDYRRRREIRHGGLSENYERRYRRRSGESVWAHVSSAPILDDEGRVAGAMGMLTDITERVRADQIMQARVRLMQFANTHSLEELLQASIDEVEALTGSTIGLYHFLEPDQKTLALQAWSTNTLAHMCTAEGRGMHYSVDQAGVWVDCVRERRPVIHNDYAALSHRKGMPVGHAEVVRELVVPVFRGDEIRAVLGVGNKPEEYGQDDVQATVTLADFAWDIAERKRAEEALAASQRKLSLHLEQTLLGVIEWDTGFRAREWNPAAEAIFGYSRDEAIGRQAAELILPEAVQPEIESVWGHLLQQKAGEFYTNENVTKDGRAILCEWINTPLVDESGSVVGVMSLARDITERVRAEKAMHEQEERIRRAYVDVLDAVTGGKLILLAEDSLARELGQPLGELGTLTSSAELADARRALMGTVATQSPGHGLDSDLIGAVSEAWNNAIKHAGGGTYQVYVTPTRLQVAVTDRGPGIDFRTLPRATLVSGFSTIASLGMGFTMMLQLCERVLLCTRDGLTVVVLEVPLVANGARSAM